MLNTFYIEKLSDMLSKHLSLEDTVKKTNFIVVVGNTDITTICGSKVSAICPVSGTIHNSINGDAQLIKISDIVSSIPPNDPVFIHSLYARQIADILLQIGITNVVDITHATWRDAQMLNRELINKNLDSIAKVYDLLSDDSSREILSMLLEFRIRMDPKVIVTSPYPQYHHPAIHPSPGEVFLDGGAFTGDTIIDFMHNLQGRLTATCFEPDAANFQILEHHILQNNMYRKVKTAPLGLWSKSAILSFDSASQSSRIVSGASNTIHVVDIDTYCTRTGFIPTLIKMDIEGAELEALSGGERTIQKFMPKLMISAYHHGSHLWDIPLRLAEMGYTRIFMGHHPPEYTIYETVVYADAE